jgi:hypothetical protein
MGLKWSDIDLDAGTLRVNRQLQRMRKDGDKPGSLVFSEPKNASRRTIDLPQRALEALRIHRKHQLEEKLRVVSYEDTDLVFATGKGTPLDAQNIVNRHFKPLLTLPTLPDYPSPRRRQVHQCSYRGLGSPLLGKADSRVQREHGPDHPCVHVLAQQYGYRGRDQEYVDERTLELAKQDL